MKTKTELYTEERQIILNKILEILNINNENKLFYLYELDADVKKQNEILELELDIKKYFNSCSWACFVKPNMKRKFLSIIKKIMKVMNCNMIAKRKLIKIGDSEKHQETFYYFI
jgi:hypothetical protein